MALGWLKGGRQLGGRCQSQERWLIEPFCAFPLGLLCEAP